MKHFVLIIIIFIYSSKAIAHGSHYEGLKKIEMDVLRNNEVIGSTSYFFEFDEDLFIVKNYTNFKVELFGVKVFSILSETIEKYKDRFGLEWRVKLDEAVSKMIEKVSPIHEKIAGLVKKAEKSGMPYSILKQVYNRGMAAWRTGHRPGTTPQQWAMARVNSFVTKSSGTWGGADKDLAAKVK